jgi:hypothetical protein
MLSRGTDNVVSKDDHGLRVRDWLTFTICVQIVSGNETFISLFCCCLSRATATGFMMVRYEAMSLTASAFAKIYVSLVGCAFSSKRMVLVDCTILSSSDSIPPPDADFATSS